MKGRREHQQAGLRSVWAAVAALGVAVAASAGPDWEEGAMGTGDAGDLPAGAQTPIGPALAPLQSITGSLNGLGVVLGDFQDMYLIHILVPSLFSATTDPAMGAGAFSTFDSQLWLFDISGLGLLGTDGAGPGATLLSAATDFSGSIVTMPGTYLLAISGFNSDPLDVGSALIFDQLTFGEISGPDGPGGANPIAGWSPAAMTGSYRIVLTGVAFVPSPGAGTLLLMGVAAKRRRRRG